MPVSPTYPGVYVQEVPSGVRTIVGVSTSVTMFVGRTKSGPMDRAIRLNNYTEFVRTFGDDPAISDMARYAKLFFLNGGTDCYVMRIAKGAQSASVTLKNEAGVGKLVLTAKGRGTDSNLIRAAVTYAGPSPETTFNIELFRWQTDSSGQRTKVEREEWLNLSMDPLSPTYAPTFLTQKSKLVDATVPAAPTAGNGFSLSGRPIVGDIGTPAAFLAAWKAVLGDTQGTANHFQISVDGGRYVDVSLEDIDVSAAGNVATLEGAIAQAIFDALDAASIPAANPPVTVKFEAGPFAPGGGATSRLRFTSLTPGKDVRIASANVPGTDVAAKLMLGSANGGLEVGAYAAERPAPNGVVFKGADVMALNDFAALLQADIDTITLDEWDAATKMFVAADITVKLETTLGQPTARMWNDASGLTGYDGVREKLALMRDAINTYRAQNASKFFWKAEVWGTRLAILPTAGEDTVLPAPATSTRNLFAGTTRFTVNVRYASLGASGVVGFQVPGTLGADGSAPDAAAYDDAYVRIDDQVDLFNLMVLPPDNGSTATPVEDLWANASVFCQQRRAFLIMDPPTAWTSSQEATNGADALRVGTVKDHSAVYFPRLLVAENGLNHPVGPAGAMAGLYSRIDASRGVWKAPAGTEADLRGVRGVELPMSDASNGQINPVGVNAIRLFPDGVVSWGARTNAGADTMASDYKYVPIRRLALFIEESLYRGLKWTVFEPNDVPLWAQIRLNVGAFMQDLFRKGAFQGTKPSDAYFVKCDAETTTQNDRNLGIVNIWVGFAPLKPAEFVVLYLQQMAGQLEA
jgi:uncharacterized protein